MNKISEQKLRRLKDLTALARALYESAVHESDPKRLELHRITAVEFAGLVNEAVEEDHILHPDLGLEMIIFIEHKAEGSDQAEAMRRDALVCLEESEKEYRQAQLLQY